MWTFNPKRTWLRPFSLIPQYSIKCRKKPFWRIKRHCVPHVHRNKVEERKMRCRAEKETGFFLSLCVTQSHARPLCPTASLCSWGWDLLTSRGREQEKKIMEGRRSTIQSRSSTGNPTGWKYVVGMQCQMLSSPSFSASACVSGQTPFDNTTHMLRCYLPDRWQGIHLASHNRSLIRPFHTIQLDAGTSEMEQSIRSLHMYGPRNGNNVMM